VVWVWALEEVFIIEKVDKYTFPFFMTGGIECQNYIILSKKAF
jgi:hypothetical protein